MQLLYRIKRITTLLVYPIQALVGDRKQPGTKNLGTRMKTSVKMVMRKPSEERCSGKAVFKEACFEKQLTFVNV